MKHLLWLVLLTAHAYANQSITLKGHLPEGLKLKGSVVLHPTVKMSNLKRRYRKNCFYRQLWDAGTGELMVWSPRIKDQTVQAELQENRVYQIDIPTDASPSLCDWKPSLSITIMALKPVDTYFYYRYFFRIEQFDESNPDHIGVINEDTQITCNKKVECALNQEHVLGSERTILVPSLDDTYHLNILSIE